MGQVHRAREHPRPPRGRQRPPGGLASLRLIVVGRARGALAEAAADYEARIAKLARFDVVEVRDEPLDRGTADEVRRREGERILGAADGWRLIACDLAGRAIASDALAARVQAWEEQPPQRTAFAIGGAEGLAPEVVAAAEQVLGFGPMTLPHQLARVVAAEQLYRALTINRGLPYHR
ncbi:MAG: 23S rRNA (pseudouridine(1915)-N(3))-methyltransferase RlmH [Gaiellales bacterium]